MSGLDTRLTESDAWIVAGLTERRNPESPADLAELIDGMDWLNRAIPSFDELSFGIDRLVRVGLASVTPAKGGGLRYSATAEAVALRRQVDRDARTLADVIRGMERILAVTHDPDLIGQSRLEGLERSDFEAAVARHERGVAWLATPIRATLAFASWLMRHRKR